MNLREIMIGTNKYIRGEGALAEVGKYAHQLGSRALIIGGKTALTVSRDVIAKSLKNQEIDFKEHIFSGDVSENQMDHLVTQAQIEQADLIIGVGGGKAIDVSKGAADRYKVPFISIPTSAATCASVVSLGICYTDAGAPAGSFYSHRSPDFTIVDSKIITEAPLRLLAAGIGDTLSKWPETKYAARNLKRTAFIDATESLGKTAFDILLTKGPKAIESVKVRRVSPEIEDIIDTNLLLSGMIGNIAGHECRLAVAHCIHDGLVELGLAKKFLHGEKVAYGTLVQMALCKDIDGDLLNEIIIFFHSLDLPISLTDFGIIQNEDNLKKIAQASQRERLQSGPVMTSVSDIKDAMKHINSMAEKYKRQ